MNNNTYSDIIKYNLLENLKKYLILNKKDLSIVEKTLNNYFPYEEIEYNLNPYNQDKIIKVIAAINTSIVPYISTLKIFKIEIDNKLKERYNYLNLEDLLQIYRSALIGNISLLSAMKALINYFDNEEKNIVAASGLNFIIYKERSFFKYSKYLISQIFQDNKIKVDYQNLDRLLIGLVYGLLVSSILDKLLKDPNLDKYLEKLSKIHKKIGKITNNEKAIKKIIKIIYKDLTIYLDKEENREFLNSLINLKNIIKDLKISFDNYPNVIVYINLIENLEYKLKK
ncbi:hypothetical protein YN1_8320 [Nanoarchaeota archaeon]